MDKETSKISEPNGAKPPVSNSKKMRCTKTLIHGFGSEDFTEGEEYDIIDNIPGGVILRNNSGYRHTILDGGWLAFFYCC